MTDTAATPIITPGNAPLAAPLDPAVQAAIDAAVAKGYEAGLAAAQSGVETAVADVIDAPAPQLTPTQQLLANLNLADTPAQVAVVDDWLTTNGYTTSPASSSTAGEPTGSAGTSTPPAAPAAS